MSERARTTDKAIKFNDLPPGESPTHEEKELLAGAGRVRRAGRVRLTFDALETRQMMDAGIGGAVTTLFRPFGGGPTPQTAHARFLAEAPPTELVKYKGASDASAALPVANGDYTFVGDDKSDFIRLYDSKTGQLIKSIDFTKQLRNLGARESSDIEGVTPGVDGMAYWIGSGGKWGSNVIFATKVTGEGAQSDLTFLGKVTNLQSAIHQWGETHQNFKVTRDGSEVVTLDKAMNKALKGNGFDKSWYNIEGIVMKPGDTTAYIALRAPLVKQEIRLPDGRTKVELRALLIPVTNFAKLFPGPNGEAATEQTPTIGDPILLDGLGGRGIRDIVYHAEWGKYVILGGNTNDGNKATLLYVWDGSVTDGHGEVHKLSTAGVREPDTNPADNHYLSFEGIGQITGNLADGTAKLLLLSDDGGLAHGKNLSDFSKRFFWGQFYSVPQELGAASLG